MEASSYSGIRFGLYLALQLKSVFETDSLAFDSGATKITFAMEGFDLMSSIRNFDLPPAALLPIDRLVRVLSK
jgi:hypothetical protein